MATDTCPDCGGELSQGLCPHRFLELGVGEVDGLAETQCDASPRAAHSASVLETLAATIGIVPHVLLRETAVGEASSQVFRPTPGRNEFSTRFRVDGEIARGGMGAVLRGRDPDLGRDVAIKVLREDLRDNGDFIRRLIEEAQIGGQLQHPGVVPIYEMGTFGDGRPFFSMKLVKGKTLAELLGGREDPADDLSRFLGIFATMAQTMAYAHTRGVIHRDLKPSNVMVGSFGEVQVMDWGLAKVLPRGGVVDDARAGKHEVSETLVTTARSRSETLVATARSGSDTDLSQAGSVLGTPSYMAPEQARGEIDRMDERADVFALGSILAEILTGAPAHTGSTVGEILRKAARGDTAEAADRLRTCGADPDLIGLALDCLAPEPDDRPRDGNVVSQRIVGYLDSTQERIQTAMRERAVAEARAVEERKQRRLQLGLAASVLTLVGLGAGSFAWTQQQRAEAARERATRAIRVAAGIDDALAAAERLRGEAQVADVEAAPARWALALAAADRAVDQVTQVGADESRTDRVSRVRDEFRSGKQAADDRQADRKVDRKLLAALEEARGNMAVHFQLSRVAEDYAAAFREAGIDIVATDPKLGGAWVAHRSDPVEMIVHLDDWASVLWRMARPRPEIDQIVAVARAADSDPWRSELRSQFLRNDPDSYDKLRKLADDPALAAQPATSQVLLAHQFGPDHTEDCIRTLRRAQHRHPDDFWLNYELALKLRNRPYDHANQAEHHTELIRFFSAALACRPKSALAFKDLYGELFALGKHEEIINACREAIRINPNEAVYYFHLGQSLQALDQLDEALEASRAALRLNPRDVQPYDRICDILTRQGNIDEAESTARQSIDADRSRGYPHQQLGIILRDQGKLDEAIAEFREARRLDAFLPEPNLIMGQILEVQGKLDEAMAEYEESARRDLSVEWANERISDLLKEKGKLDQAVAASRRSIQSNPSSVFPHLQLGNLLRVQSKLDEAIAEYREARRYGPGEIIPFDRLCETLTERGQLDEAATTARESIRTDPSRGYTYFLLGEILRKQNKPGEALVVYRTAVDRDPRATLYYDRLCDIQTELGKLDEAIDTARESIQTDPTRGYPHYQLGNLLRAHGDAEDAIREYRAATRLDPGEVVPFDRICDIRSEQGRLDEAAETARESLRSHPTRGYTHRLLGIILRSQGKFDEAVKSLRESSRLEPDSHIPNSTLGQIFEAQGRPDDAIVEYQETVRRNPNDFWAFYRISDLLKDQGKYQEAIASARESIRIHPEWPHAYPLLGAILQAQGKPDEAIGAIREAYRRDPNNGELFGRLLFLLRSRGKYPEAVTVLCETLHRIDANSPARSSLTQTLVQVERMANLTDRFPALLQGDDHPRDQSERLDLIQICQDSGRHVAAARLYDEALKVDPKLGDERTFQHRYNAACSAAQAGGGRSQDDPAPDDAARAELRGQALRWLREEMEAWQQAQDAGPPPVQATIAPVLQHWKRDPDLVSVRDDDDLARWPQAERTAWQTLWKDVDALLAKAQNT